MQLPSAGLPRLVALGALATWAVLGGCQPAASPPSAPAAPRATPSPTSAPRAASPAASPATGTAGQLRDLTKYLDASIASLQKNDFPTAKEQYTEFDEGWDRVEDGVKAQSADQYRAIEDAMGEVKGTLVTPNTPDVAKSTDAVKKLKKTVEDALPSLR